MAGDNQQGRIVAGVDGSDTSKKALRWAVDQAHLTGAGVEAVIAWDYPAFYMTGLQTALNSRACEEDFTASVANRLADAVTEVVGPEGDSTVVQRVVRGDPAEVLLDAAKSAQLLVVGSSGHRRFAVALLGSVALHCVQHASTPMVIVPRTED
jgi:nucleotide-binding universal stress UspA family protein